MVLPMYKLRIPEYLANDIRSLHPDIKKKVKHALKAITDDPYAGKALKDELKGLRSFRVKRFRIIYQVIDKKEIQLVALGPRACIYEETYRLLKKEEKSGE